MSTKLLNIKLTKIEQFLVSVLTHKDYLDSKSIINLFYEIGDENLFSTCQYNKIESIAAEALRKCFKEKDLENNWQNSYDYTNELIKSYMTELDRVAELLAKNHITLVALKNSGITRGLYPFYGSCPMGDLDVLVRKSDFRKAHEVLVESGYQLKFRSPLEEENIDKAEQGGGAEYAAILPNGDNLWFELQWRPIAGRWIRHDQEPSGDELMDRSIEINGSLVRLLAPEDNLLQVCLHTAKHSYVRAPGFRLHTDVDRVVRSCSIDWLLFIQRVKQLQVKTPVFFSLALASDLLKTPIPEGVLSQLKPSGWKVWLISKWLQKVGLFDPDGKKWNRLGYIVFVSLLYDSIGGLLRGIIPDKKWMKQRYGVESSFVLPFFYIYRLLDLVWKRTLKK